MAKHIDLSKGKVIHKNKDYGSVEQAQVFYEKQRLTQLSITLYPKDCIPKGFKEMLQYLMRYQNPVSMNVWHNKNVIIRNEETGENISTTWDNMCSFNRPFMLAEMFQVIEILKRATPNEIYNKERAEELIGSEDVEESIAILRFFNEVAYPEVEEVTNYIQNILDEMEEQICNPIRAEINTNLKIMMNIPLTETIVFIKGKERKM